MSYQTVPNDCPDTPPPSVQQKQDEPPNYTNNAPAQPPQSEVFVAAQPAQYANYQQQYMVQQPYVGAGGMVVVPPRLPLLPRELQPNDYLVVTLVVTIVCGILNITSLFFSIPAVVCSVMAYERRSIGGYEIAKQLGYAAIILNVLCVTWVMIWSVIVVGLLTGCVRGVGILC